MVETVSGINLTGAFMKVFFAVIGWAVIIIAAVIYFVSGETSSDASEASNSKLPSVCKNDGMAFVMSQKFVKRELKAPDSASFSYKPTSSASLGECKFRIKAYVDAQNSFGAKIRNNYTIDMEYLRDSKNWRGTNLSMK